MASFALVFVGTALLASQRVVHHHQENKIIVRTDQWGWMAKPPTLIATAVQSAPAAPIVARVEVQAVSVPTDPLTADRIVTSRAAPKPRPVKIVREVSELKRLQAVHEALISQFEYVATSGDREAKPILVAKRAEVTTPKINLNTQGDLPKPAMKAVANTMVLPVASPAKSVSTHARITKPVEVSAPKVSNRVSPYVSPYNDEQPVGVSQPRSNLISQPEPIQDPELASRVQKLFASYFSPQGKTDLGKAQTSATGDSVLLTASTGAKLTIQKAQQGTAFSPTKTSPKASLNTQALLDSRGRVIKNYVEAFSVDTQVVVDEKSRLGNWVTLKASNHIPTIASTLEDRVPLLSENSRRILELSAGAIYQASSGIVYGVLPDGMGVEYSGRSEKPILFDSNYNVVAPSERRGVRTFVLLNAQPGANIVRMINVKGASEFAVGVPVFVGSATYVNFDGLTEKTIRGNLILAQESGASPIARAQVTLPGFSAAATRTDREGNFQFSHIKVSEKYPLVFETESEGGFVHRSQMIIHAEERIFLYQFGTEQISSWIHSLEGGVSELSGLLVGAFPQLVENRGDGELFPTVKSLAEAPAFAPETYLLSATGQLMSREPMRTESSRVVSVQLPEGLGIIKIEDREEKTRYSELFFVSPGVVNVIGPQ